MANAETQCRKTDGKWIVLLKEEVVHPLLKGSAFHLGGAKFKMSCKLPEGIGSSS